MAINSFHTCTNGPKKSHLKVNTNKTKAIIFRTKNKVISEDIQLLLGQSRINIVPTMKCLGVVFSETLNWDAQIQHTRMKMNKIIGVLCRHRYSLPTSVKILIYNAFLLPIITYCHIIWGTTTKQNKLKLLLAQKRAVRLIANVSWCTHTEQYFFKFSIIKSTSLYAFKLLCMYKSAVATNNDVLLSMFKLNRHTPAYNIRHNIAWSLPFCRTSYRAQSLCYNLPLYLNILLHNNISIETTPKKKLIDVLHLLDLHFV